MALVGSMSTDAPARAARRRSAPRPRAIPTRVVVGDKVVVARRPGRGGRVTDRQRLLHDSLLASAAAFPEQEAIVDEYRQRTYAGARAARCGSRGSSQDAGLERGDRVGLYLDNTVACATAIFGVWLAGGVVHRRATRRRRRTSSRSSSTTARPSFLVTEAHACGWPLAAVERRRASSAFASTGSGSPAALPATSARRRAAAPRAGTPGRIPSTWPRSSTRRDDRRAEGRHDQPRGLVFASRASPSTCGSSPKTASSASCRSRSPTACASC